MTITGYQFDRAKVSATKDSALYNALARSEDFVLPKQGKELAVTTSGRTIRVDTGMALIQGRLVEVTAPESVTIPANSSGYLVIEINLSQTNTSNTSGSVYTFVNNQVSLKFVTSLSTSRISDTGLLYHFNLGAVTANSNSASFTQSIPAYRGGQSLRDQFYPVGTIYQSTNSTNPESFIGGKWQRFGEGRVLVGISESDEDFNASGKVGGEKTHTLTTEELPSHSHQINTESSQTPIASGWENGNSAMRSRGAAYTMGIDGRPTGGNQPHNNLQPYITVYMWQRIA